MEGKLDVSELIAYDEFLSAAGMGRHLEAVRPDGGAGVKADAGHRGDFELFRAPGRFGHQVGVGIAHADEHDLGAAHRGVSVASARSIWETGRRSCSPNKLMALPPSSAFWLGRLSLLARIRAPGSASPSGKG